MPSGQSPLLTREMSTNEIGELESEMQVRAQDSGATDLAVSSDDLSPIYAIAPRDRKFRFFDVSDHRMQQVGRFADGILWASCVAGLTAVLGPFYITWTGGYVALVMTVIIWLPLTVYQLNIDPLAFGTFAPGRGGAFENTRYGTYSRRLLLFARVISPIYMGVCIYLISAYMILPWALLLGESHTRVFSVEEQLRPRGNLCRYLVRLADEDDSVRFYCGYRDRKRFFAEEGPLVLHTIETPLVWTSRRFERLPYSAWSEVGSAR